MINKTIVMIITNTKTPSRETIFTFPPRFLAYRFLFAKLMSGLVKGSDTVMWKEYVQILKEHKTISLFNHPLLWAIRTTSINSYKYVTTKDDAIIIAPYGRSHLDFILFNAIKSKGTVLCDECMREYSGRELTTKNHVATVNGDPYISHRSLICPYHHDAFTIMVAIG